MRCSPQWPGGAVGPCRIALVGEAPGAEEEAVGKPFIGPSGRLLDHMLKAAGIDRASCLVTNVFMERPKGNNISLYFEKRSAAKAAGHHSDLPPCGVFGLLKPEWRPEIDRLKAELIEAKPNVIVALGVVAMWALLNKDKIGTYRGVVLPSTLLPGRKVLGTYHPAAIIREFSHRPIAIADLMKVRTESAFPEIQTTPRVIWVADKVSDLARFESMHLRPAGRFAFDVETADQQVTHIAVAPSPLRVLVIPFIQGGKSVWNEQDEVAIWTWLYGLMSDPSLQKIAHNSVYDLTYMMHHGLPVRGRVDDTMLLHHAMQPELLKSLGMLGSLYSAESAWKTLRVKPAYLVTKKDE